MAKEDFSAEKVDASEPGRLFDAGEAELRMLLENSPIGIALVRDRIIVRVNQSVCALFGYTREELVGASTRLIYANEGEYERVGRELRERGLGVAGTMAPVEFVGRHKNGHAIDAIVQGAFLDRANPSAGTMCVVTDITDRVRTERDLQEKNRQLGTLLSHLPGMAYRCANDPSWTMELVSEGCLGLTGYTAEEMRSNGAFADLILEEDRAGVWDAVQVAVAKREPFQLNYRIRAKDQQVRWVWEQGAGVFNSSGQLEALEGLILDVTQQKQFELGLRESEEKYRGIFTHSVAGIFRIHPSGRYISVNPALAQMHGYASPEEMIALVSDVSKQIYVCPEDRERVLQKLRAEGRVQNFELEVQRKNGARFWISVNATAVFGEDGKIAYVEGTNLEITEQKRAEALLKAKTAAEAASRAKSAFLTHMSHELRTPMNAMLGFCQLLLRDQQLSSKQREYLQTIDRNGQHLLGIISDILEMAKIDANRLSFAFNRFPAATLLRDLESTFRARAELKRLDFSFSVDPAAPKELWADRLKVRQVLINLIGNAFKFTQQGSVKVKVRAAGPTERDDRLYFEVADTGPGICPEDLERLFEPFEQTAAGAMMGGTGLGLPISREYARRMQGDLTVRSTFNVGSVFCLALPIPIGEEQGEPLLTPREIPFGTESRHPGGRVLVVDDFEDNRRLLRGVLADGGWSVREVDNGLDAVAMQAQWKPDCIIMDARMPGLDGLEAIRRIRKTDITGVKILMLSAGAEEGQRDEAIAAGADDFQAKPFRPETLLATLRGWLSAKEGDAAKATAVQPRGGETIPASWTAEMKQALTEADLEKISALLETLGHSNAALATEFSKMAERFDFEAIRRGIEAV